MKKSPIAPTNSIGLQLPHLTSPRVSTLTTWPLPKFLVPSPVSCWDGAQPRTPSLVRFQVPANSAFQSSVILLLWLGVQMILQKPGAGGCSWGWPGSWLFSFPSITAGKSPLSLPSEPSVIVSFAGTEQKGNWIYS